MEGERSNSLTPRPKPSHPSYILHATIGVDPNRRLWTGWVVFQGAVGSSSQACIHVPRSGGLVIKIEEAINKDVGVDCRIGAWF